MSRRCHVSIVSFYTFFSITSHLISLYLGREKITAILQTPYSNIFSNIEIVAFWYEFHWHLFRGIHLIVISYSLEWFGTEQAINHYLHPCLIFVPLEYQMIVLHPPPTPEKRKKYKINILYRKLFSFSSIKFCIHPHHSLYIGLITALSRRLKMFGPDTQLAMRRRATSSQRHHPLPRSRSHTQRRADVGSRSQAAQSAT